MATVQFAVTTPKITVNNQNIAIKPNSFKFTEGLGEQKVDVQSAGGNAVQQVIKQDANTMKSSVKFALENTIANIEVTKTWKLNPGANAITATAAITGDFTRTFSLCTLINNYEVGLGVDTDTELEFEGQQAN